MQITKPMSVRMVGITPVSLLLSFLLASSAAKVDKKLQDGRRLQVRLNRTLKPRKDSDRGPSFMALKAGTHASKSESGAQEREQKTQLRQKTAKREKSYFSHLMKALHLETVHKRQHSQKVDLCDGNEFAWMVEIRQQCRDDYGDDSDWDQEAGDGACRTAWNECNGEFASTCCTQPEGPSSMESYCNGTSTASGDRACEIRAEMGEIEESVRGIREAVGIMDTTPPEPPLPTLFEVQSGDCSVVDGGRCIVSPHWPEDYEHDEGCEIKAPAHGVVYPRVKLVAREFDTEGCCDRLSIGDTVFGGSELSDGPDDEVDPEAREITWTSDYSSAKHGWKICAEDIVPSPAPPALPECPPPVAAAPSPGGAPSPGFMAPAPFPCVPRGMMPDGLAVPSPAPDEHRVYPPDADKPSMLEMQCRRLQSLVERAGRNIDSVRDWADTEGIGREDSEETSRRRRRDDDSSSRRRDYDSSSSSRRRDYDSSSSSRRRSSTSSYDDDDDYTSSSRRRSISLLGIALDAGVKNSGEGVSEASDPDLTFAMRRVLTIGEQVDELRDTAICDQFEEEVEDDSLDGDAAADAAAEAAAAAANATAAQVAKMKKIKKKMTIKVNGGQITKLLKWETSMGTVVKEYETKVHPHGKKWWRYRYEYTLVESLVLAVAVLVLYVVMYLLHGISFFHKFKFYNIGLTKKLYRYSWAYFVFHAASLMVMTTVAYMLYMPWGESNVFDYCGKAFHKAIDGYANVPYEGYSWLLMFLDVQFQLFGCFALYALFVVFVTRNFTRALDDWKHYGEKPNESSDRHPSNDYRIQEFQEIMERRVRASPELQRAFAEVRLSYKEGEQPRQDAFEFKLHLYFTDCLGKSLEYLVEVSLKTILFLAVSAVGVAFLAHHYQVAFMYFLPLFLIVGFLLFAIGYIIARQLMHDDHRMPPHLTTMHAYCRKIQVALYCVFFGFSRLLLSSDIYQDYPRVYLAASVGLLVTLLMCWTVLPGIMKVTLCLINLPHDRDVEKFKVVLQNVAYWHTTENCHECGVRQAPPTMSISREFAAGAKGPGYGGISDRSGNSGRGFSFR